MEPCLWLARSATCKPLSLTVHCVTGERNAAASTVQQRLVFVGKDAGKGFALRDLLRGGGLKAPILVFVSSSERAKQLHR